MKKHLTCSPKERNRFLHRTEQMLDAFLEENPDATKEDLYLALGSPEELAEQMMEECVFNEGKNSLNKHLNKITITSVVLGVALLFLSITAYCYFTINIKTEISPIQYVYSINGPTPLPSFGPTKLE